MICDTEIDKIGQWKMVLKMEENGVKPIFLKSAKWLKRDAILDLEKADRDRRIDQKNEG